MLTFFLKSLFLFAFCSSVISSSALSDSTIPQSIIQTVISNPNNSPHPTTVQSYLEGGCYYGGARERLQADQILEQAKEWQLEIHDYQYRKRDQEQMNEMEFVPGTSQNPHLDWKDDAFSIYHSCFSQSENELNNLQTNCGENCNQTFMVADLWGTLDGMDWKKDGILFQACGIISITNSDECFSDFPTSCSIQSRGEYYPLFGQNVIQSGSIVEFGTPSPKSKDQLLQELRSFAKTSNQNLTISST